MQGGCRDAGLGRSQGDADAGSSCRKAHWRWVPPAGTTSRVSAACPGVRLPQHPWVGMAGWGLPYRCHLLC